MIIYNIIFDLSANDIIISHVIRTSMMIKKEFVARMFDIANCQGRICFTFFIS
jgi:hypothetical protein